MHFILHFLIKIVVIIFRFGSWNWAEANLSSDCVYPWRVVRVEQWKCLRWLSIG